MNLFKKKNEEPKTVQEIQQKTMDIQFGVLRTSLEMNALRQKLRELEALLNEQIREWETLTKLKDATKEKIKGEINETIANGEKNPSALI